MTGWLQPRLAALGTRLDGLSCPAYISAVAAATIALSVFFFSPKFQLWNYAAGDNFEVSRARTFLAQCEEPFRRDIEPAMQWRLLPPLVCHALGFRGRAALTVPWLGVLVLLGTCTALLRREGLTRLQAGLATALVGTTSAVIVPLGWLGMNDAWVWAGLVGVAFGRTAWSLAPAALLLPWVDERFIIGLPLAAAVRCALTSGAAGPTVSSYARAFAAAAAWLLPYVVVRLVLHARGFGDAGGSFVRDAAAGFMTWLPFAPLGWWMALRAGWVAIVLALSGPLRIALTGGSLVFGTVAVMALLAADLSRSAAILLPVMLFGMVRLARRDPPLADSRLAALLAINLILPALHVVHVKTDLISPLPLEIYRLLRAMHHPIA